MKRFAATQRCNTGRDKTVAPSEVYINTSHPNRLSRPLIRTDTSLDRESRAFHCIHYQLSRHREAVHTTASVTSCRDTPPTPYPKLSYPWDSMEAAKLPHALCPHQFSVPVPNSNVADKNRYCIPFTTYQNRPKLCCLEACREHRETRRDVVSGQTEGNSARVAEDVLRVEGFSHKIVQVHQ